MCVTSANARLSETRILSLRLNERKRLLCYTNKAENLSVLPNSMILPIPGRLSEADFIDTTAFPGFMTELERYLTPQSRGNTLSKGVGDTMRGPVQHFKSGMYEVFVADPDPFRNLGPMNGKTTIAEQITGKRQKQPHSITEALQNLDPIDRPDINEELLEFYDQYYRNWSLVVCVFGPGKKMESQPIMFTYEPLDEWKDQVFLPGVDSHNGRAPLLNEDVDVDHFLITESSSGAEIPATPKCPPQLHGCRLAGIKWKGEAPNGDWVGPFSENSSRPRLHRVCPGW